MAMQINLADLQKKCEKLGLVVKQAGKRPAKADFVKVLRAHFLAQDYPTGLPFEEVEPQLCFASWNLKPEELETIWQSENWIADRKENGCRGIIHFTSQGVFAHSRNVSVKSFRMEEFTQNLLFRDFKGLDGWTIDVEAIIEKPVDTSPYTSKGGITKTSLHSTTAVMALAPESSRKLQIEQGAPFTFKVIDVVKAIHPVTKEVWDARRAPLSVRLRWRDVFFQELEMVNPELAAVFKKMPYASGTAKKAFCDQVMKEGGEGVVLKNLRKTYEDSSSRQRDNWVKVKKRIEYDAFVSGFKRGEPGSGWENLVGALEFSVHTEAGTHVLGYASNITLEERKRITVADADGTISMLPEVYGKVAEISGQDVSAREFRLSHCTLDRWRDQAGDIKMSADCKVSMADLKQAAEWVS